MNLVENWFLWFLFYSIVGWVWEVIICSIPQSLIPQPKSLIRRRLK